MLFRALVTGEPPALRQRLSRVLRLEGLHVVADGGGGSLWARLERGGFDLLVATAVALPEPWSETLGRIRALPERTEVVAVVEPDRPQDRAVMHAAGAFAVLHADLVENDWQASLHAVLQRFRELAQSRLRAALDTQGSVADLASDSPVMQRLLDLAHRVAQADTTLLILGETGVGKEWLARAIHGESPRAEAPFVPVNCAAVPESLMEAELFGHEAGAFTGATRSRRGAFEIAHRGTLFLDEIGDLPVHLQSKLLRALQETRVQRLGAELPVTVDARIVAATNRDLNTAMEQGAFRRDLYYRLSVVTLHIPPLRERREDIRPLANAYLEHFRKRLGRPRLLGFTNDSLRALEGHPWPGNVRELANTVERAVLLAEHAWIEAADLLESPRPGARAATEPRSRDDLPDTTSEAPLPAARRAALEAFERAYLDRTLARHGGRVGDAARAAGIDPRTLYNKMRAYGLRKQDYRPPPR